jgi:hypothetical protein
MNFVFSIPGSVSLRRAISPTLEQRRAIYLATRSVVEEALAVHWRIQTTTCDRCGARGEEHSLWCDNAK